MHPAVHERLEEKSHSPARRPWHRHPQALSQGRRDRKADKPPTNTAVPSPHAHQHRRLANPLAPRRLHPGPNLARLGLQRRQRRRRVGGVGTCGAHAGRRRQISRGESSPPRRTRREAGPWARHAMADPQDC